jgi:hypothetical protein
MAVPGFVLDWLCGVVLSKRIVMGLCCLEMIYLLSLCHIRYLILLLCMGRHCLVESCIHGCTCQKRGQQRSCQHTMIAERALRREQHALIDGRDGIVRYLGRHACSLLVEAPDVRIEHLYLE